MAKQGEIDYLKNLGAEGIAHALHKPFSDPACGNYLMELGAVLSLLPAPPARLLDLGCGTGWTSCWFAKRGYQVTGQDIAPDMIAQAQSWQQREGLANLELVVCDYETMTFEAEFDCAVFFDSLHHAIDERLALQRVYQALKPGGVCITSEPGWGHSRNPATIQAVEQFGVTERDMPPGKIAKVAKQVGFRQARVYPHAYHLNLVYRQPRQPLLRSLLHLPLLKPGMAFLLAAFYKHLNGIVLLTK